MAAKPKPDLRKPADEWEEFRPVALTRGRSPRSVPKLLVLSTFLFFVFVVVWLVFKPQLKSTVAEIQKALAEMAQSRAPASKSRAATAAITRRATRVSRPGRAEAVEDATRVPGPFEVYLLDGDRYIRVDASSRSVLLNMQTGETTWVDSDRAPDR